MLESELAVGRWVYYTGGYGPNQKGRIKHWRGDWVFVVYKCGDDWNNYQDYTAARTNRKYLIFAEEM